MTISPEFVAAKTFDRMKQREISYIPADKAGLAKRAGRKLKLREDWEMVKISIMRRFLMQKFSYNSFKTKLLETGDVLIVEGNYWHDNYWGD